MRNLKCYILPLCSAVLFSFAASPIIQVTMAEDAATLSAAGASDEETLAGTYRADDGSVAQLYQPNDSSTWVMTMDAAGEAPMTIYLEGSEDSLAPVGLTRNIKHRGHEIEVNVDRDDVYASGLMGEKEVELFRDSSMGSFASALNGKASSDHDATTEELELKLILGELSKDWSVMRNASVQVSEESLSVLPAGAEQMKALSDGRMGHPKAFSKQDDLSDEDLETFAATVNSRNEKLKKAGGFMPRMESDGER